MTLRLWAANLRTARERTVLESHLEGWIGAFWALPPGPAVRTLDRLGIAAHN